MRIETQCDWLERGHGLLAMLDLTNGERLGLSPMRDDPVVVYGLQRTA